MAMILIESIGFSATSSISKMLQMGGQNYVSHGTRNFKDLTPLGTNDLTLPIFIGQMHQLHNKYKNCIAVHCMYDVQQLKKELNSHEIRFLGLMRKSQKAQILSCFFWAVEQFLNGRPEFLGYLTKLHTENFKLLNNIGLQANFVNCFMLYSFFRVLLFNFELSKFSDYIIYMEDFLENGFLTVKNLNLTGVDNRKYILDKSNSHKSRVRRFNFLEDAESSLEVMIDRVRLTIDGSKMSCGDFEHLFLEHAAKN